MGVNLHDNDLVPIVRRRHNAIRSCVSSNARDDHNIKVPMATVNLFYDPVFRDGAFTRTTVTFARTRCRRR